MKIILSLMTLALAGCSLAPTLKAPDVEVPQQYKEAAQLGTPLSESEKGAWKEAAPAEHLARGEWWRLFNDETLNTLETQAVAANPQLQAAAARLRQARAIVDVVNADRLPQVGTLFGVNRQKPTGALLNVPEDTNISPYNTWRAELGASWEVDLFGRIGDGVRAARSDADSSEATYRSLMLALQADVATVYFQLRAADTELALLRDTVGWREQNVDLTQKRFDAGASSELDLARAKTELSTTRSEMHALERQRARLEHALAVLLGKTPASFDLEPQVLKAAVPSVPAGLPSTLLERRPDVVAAQHSLVAANARIGVARAAFFPVLNLTASGGYASSELKDLFDWSSRTWVLGPLAGTMLTLPIFTGGRNTANLDRSWAEYDEAVANYRNRVLNAFADVEDGLSDLRTLGAQAAANSAALESSRRASGITDARYKAGAVSYFEVIDAQRSQLSIERLNVQIEGAQRTATVALIRALGGGWDNPPAVAAQAR